MQKKNFSRVVSRQTTPEMRGKALARFDAKATGLVPNDYLAEIDRKGVPIKLLKQDVALLKRILQVLADNEEKFLDCLAEQAAISSGDSWGLWKLRVLFNLLSAEVTTQIRTPRGKFLGIWTLLHLEENLKEDQHTKFLRVSGLDRLKNIE